MMIFSFVFWHFWKKIIFGEKKYIKGEKGVEGWSKHHFQSKNHFSGRRLIRDIEDEHNGVHILFPKEKSNSDKVVIRGPKNDVAAAEKALKEVAKHCEETTEEASITTKPEYIRFLIGREGSNIKKLREKYPNVRIMFPTEQDTDCKIWLVGKKDEVGVESLSFLGDPVGALFRAVAQWTVSIMLKKVVHT